MAEEMVSMEVEISDEEFLYVAKMAHERDITFNQMMNEILEWYVKKETESGESND